MVGPLDESQGSSPLQGHGPWLMCEVGLVFVYVFEAVGQLVRVLQIFACKSTAQSKAMHGRSAPFARHLEQ